MEMPNITTTRVIQGTEFIFSVRAYRTLTDLEMQQAFAFWKSQKRIKNTPKRGKVVVISMHGSDGSNFPI